MLSLPPARSTYNGTDSVHLRGFLIWNSLPSYIKSNVNQKIKNFRDTDCGFLICRI